MGLCCSADSLPDVPTTIIPDPAINEAEVTFSTAKFGSYGRDYGVWKGSKIGGKKELWFWLNKSDGPTKGTAVIDAENFDRDEKTKKGKVYWSAQITERPNFQQFQRPARKQNGFRFMGIDQGYESESDDYYVNSGSHQSHRRHTNLCRGDNTGQEVGDVVHDIGAPVITKWRVFTSARITDGNLGRGQASVGNSSILLEVFSKGSGITSWQSVTSKREVPDGPPPEGEDAGPQKYKVETSTSVNKAEAEFVDRIEFRLSFNGRPITSWTVQGDVRGSEVVAIENDLFKQTNHPGMFTKSYVETVTKPGLDPILALLVSHLCTTEFSIVELKNDLKLNTPPGGPPSSFGAPQPFKYPHNMSGPAINWGSIISGISGAATSVAGAASSGANAAGAAVGSVDWAGGANAAGSAISGAASSAYDTTSGAVGSVDWAGGANAAGSAISDGASSAYEAAASVDYQGAAEGAYDAAQSAAAAVESEM